MGRLGITAGSCTLYRRRLGSLVNPGLLSGRPWIGGEEDLKALVYITPKEGILDPQGLTVGKALRNLGMKQVADVRIGKYVEIDLPKTKRKKAEEITKQACDRLLANPNIEAYRFEIVEDG
ncbi:MAG: phosphoribosylformylglycinamidine synthase subunit PurS [Fidelibacterota bacterium]|nr:MAG: phosphoribosylformylglycinamidine synthase subunit PurS [Candidatus Neomarinimicrobiota bacterium]